jgi:hypothetical protein
MQIQRFENGGFVIHKLNVGGVLYSAWFDGEGRLLDAERKSRRGMFTVGLSSKSTNVRKELERIGRIHAERTEVTV